MKINTINNQTGHLELKRETQKQNQNMTFMKMLFSWMTQLKLIFPESLDVKHQRLELNQDLLLELLKTPQEQNIYQKRNRYTKLLKSTHSATEDQVVEQ